MDSTAPHEGALYRSLEIDGHRFELRYGYYEEGERILGEPVVVYPDLEKRRMYCNRGYRLVTAVQTPCAYYTISGAGEPEYCCSDCLHYSDPAEEIARCLCIEQQKPQNNPSGTNKENGK